VTDIHDAPEAGDEYARFENLAQKVVNTPKPKPESAEQLPAPADDDSERERA
jgi:hypothetical protein